MRAKRLDVRAIFVGAALVVATPLAARAQLQGGVWRLPPGSATQKGIQVTHQPTIVVVPSHSRPVHRTVFPRYPVATTMVPAVIMSDGSVVTNYDRRHRPAHPSCAGAVVSGQFTVIGGNGVILSQPQVPTYTQPVPNQATASQLMAQANLQRNVVVVGGGHPACGGRNPGRRASGRPF